jgi:hypothetical protein
MKQTKQPEEHEDLGNIFTIRQQCTLSESTNSPIGRITKVDGYYTYFKGFLLQPRDCL